jgi:hypothetical protein
MCLRVAFLLLVALPTSADPANGGAVGIPTTDADFAAHVLQFSVAGRKTEDVLKDLRGTGFTCLEHENRVLSDSARSVTFQKHLCGGPVPALHGCARNVELATFDGTLKHIRISLEHPDGTPNAGRACAR